MVRYILASLMALPLPGAVDAARIDAVLSEYEPEAPGCVLAVMKDGCVLHEGVRGMGNLEHRVPLSRFSIFELASASKAFTALAALLLERDGKLALDDSVTKFIPQLPEYARPITIRHLLGHTSGLRDVPTLLMLAGRTYDDTTEWPELLALISRQKELNFPSGRAIRYSNTGYLLAAQIIRLVSGKTLREFAKERIFVPLGMKDTRYVDNRWELILRRASGYSREERGFTNNNSGAVDMTGAAGVHSSLEDMERWAAAFFDRDSELAPLIARMQEMVRLDDGEPAQPVDLPIQFGLGLIRRLWGKQGIVEQSGSWGGYRSGIYHVPEKGFSVVCLCNRSDPDPDGIARRVAELFYPDMREEPRVPPPRAETSKTGGEAGDIGEWKAFEGHYRSDELAAEYRLIFRDGSLHAEVGHVDLKLSPDGRGRFRSGPFVLSIAQEGLVITVDHPLFGMDHLQLRRVR